MAPATPFDPRLALLTRYKAWADDTLYTTLAPLPPKTLSVPTPIFAGSILRTLNHVQLIDRVWQAHLLGVPHGFTTRNPETPPTLAALRDAQHGIDQWYVHYAETLAPDQHDERVDFTFIGDGGGAMTRADIILHAVNHTTYHRGHITAMLNQAGIAPPATDLPVYLREADAHRA